MFHFIKGDLSISKRQLDHFCLLQTIYYACIFGGDGRP